MAKTEVKFPENFVWGAATSAYQIEGAVTEDGKGEHIWDVYTKEPGKIYSGHTGEVACDHYHRYKEDVQLMKAIGLKAYRFSIDWSRVLPEGYGRVNEKAIAFYNALIDELLENEIEPYITLYHWELPYEIYKRGGWMNPQIVEWFGEYAKLVAERFSDRVTHFFTLNEPQCFVGLGFLTGEHAPGVKAPLRDTFEMAHNALKAHGRAVQMLRAYGKQKLTIGYAPTSSVCYPETNRPEDIEAARQMYFSMQEDDSNWTWNVAWWSDPVLLGHYPEEGLVRYEKYLPKITDADMKLILLKQHKHIAARCQKKRQPKLTSIYERYLHLNICFAFIGFYGGLFLFEKFFNYKIFNYKMNPPPPTVGAVAALLPSVNKWLTVFVIASWMFLAKPVLANNNINKITATTTIIKPYSSKNPFI